MYWYQYQSDSKFYPDSIYDKFDHTVTEIGKTKFKDIVSY